MNRTLKTFLLSFIFCLGTVLLFTETASACSGGACGYSAGYSSSGCGCGYAGYVRYSYNSYDSCSCCNYRTDVVYKRCYARYQGIYYVPRCYSYVRPYYRQVGCVRYVCPVRRCCY